MPISLPTGALPNIPRAAEAGQSARRAPNETGLPERQRASALGNGSQPEAQYVDLEVPKSPPQLHEIHRALQALGVQVGSVRSRVSGDRLALSVQVAEIDGGALCAVRLAEVARALMRFACHAAPALARAGQSARRAATANEAGQAARRAATANEAGQAARRAATANETGQSARRAATANETASRRLEDYEPPTQSGVHRIVRLDR